MIEKMESFFERTEGPSLAQGDLLDQCPIPLFPPDFGAESTINTVPFRLAKLIVMTQSCDLENRKVPLVALCPIFGIPALAAVDTKFNKAGELENLRKGRYEALHMLASPETPTDNMGAIIVDFRQIFSLPIDFLSNHALKSGKRWRLQSPYLEHFSQAFARFFMRVGLPSAIPPFGNK